MPILKGIKDAQLHQQNAINMLSTNITQLLLETVEKTKIFS